jgi:hypothetical protein
MSYQKLSIALPIMLLFAAILACARPDDPPYAGVERDAVGTGTVFIWAVGNGDEELAMSKLSTRTQAAVAEHCEQGRVIACFNQVGLQDWGTIELENIASLPRYSNGLTIAYQTIWSNNRPIWMTLNIVAETGEWRVESWRVWAPVTGESPGQQLIDGTGYNYSFPPKQ